MLTEMLNFLAESFLQKTPEWISAGAAVVSMFGIWFVRQQLVMTKDIAQLQFEDALEKEYRDLISTIPTKALLDSELNDQEYEATFDEFFRYFDLSNRQIELRKEGRIGDATWKNWRLGIKFNMAQPSFKKAWMQVKLRTEDHAAEFFSELRALEISIYNGDPKIGTK
jgi:23S rRNA C2498 (ribose-2'-O)-methylase RlmM